jgi:peptidoglycan/xylan/chitin deacetylase (PgdA/CDA1 family)
MKAVNVFFDLEDQTHKPDICGSDMEENVQRILQTLDKFNAKAVFCTCGIVVETCPSLIKRIYEKGNEIASHGYQHENFAQLTQDELDLVLSKTEKAINETIGEPPVGIRCPWLLSNKKIYDVIGRRGYRWVSNKYHQFPEIQNKPDANPSTTKTTSFSIGRMKKEREIRKSWESFPKEPYRINRLFEIPMLSSMDGDLLFYLSPIQNSPSEWLDYAYGSLVTQFNRSGKYFNLNFHPWVIASANRISLLERILDYLSGQDVEYVLAKDYIDILASKMK